MVATRKIVVDKNPRVNPNVSMSDVNPLPLGHAQPSHVKNGEASETGGGIDEPTKPQKKQAQQENLSQRMEKMMACLRTNLGDLDEDSNENALEEPNDKENIVNPTNVGTPTPTKDKRKQKVGELQTRNALIPLKKSVNATNQPLRTQKATNTSGLGPPSAPQGKVVPNKRFGAKVPKPKRRRNCLSDTINQYDRVEEFFYEDN
uniref:Uncharacterized protein n=1 Tax=Cannabis sativa TaxID=3483 RepID=A0A803QKS0_CANSA